MKNTVNQNDVPEMAELIIEDFTKENPSSPKPPAQSYVIRIDRENRRVKETSLTGTEILALVDKTPKSHKLFQKLHGGETKVVEPNESVSFVQPGIERFTTIPKDTTEGIRNV